MSNTYALHYLIPIYVLFGGLLLFMYHWFWGSESHSRHLFSEKKKRLPFFAPAKTTVDSAAALSPTEPKHRWQLKSGVIAEGGIHATLAQLRSLAGAESVRLFAKLNNQWLPVAEVRGQLTVRGEAMELPSLLTQPFASTEEFLFDTVYGECLAFNKAPQNAELCFVLKLNSTKEIAESEMRERIGTFVKTHSRSLLVEHYYESSILDAESGLYSFPYAMFTLKEKILGGLTFSAAVFQFPESFFTSSHLSKIARTAIRAMREYFAADEAPVIARGSGNRLFIIFNARREGAKDYAEEATLKLFTSYENIFKTEFQLQAGFVADAAGFGSSTRAIKILERLLDES
ncbi:MAG TPA: hypothetical protein PLY93_02655, partial [Turneriella sp.]|nr:hypothetical protein [Turneriella sp.]